MSIRDTESRLHDLHEKRAHIQAQMSALRDELWDIENEIEFQRDHLDALIEREEELEDQAAEQYRQSLEAENGDT